MKGPAEHCCVTACTWPHLHVSLYFCMFFLCMWRYLQAWVKELENWLVDYKATEENPDKELVKGLGEACTEMNLLMSLKAHAEKQGLVFEAKVSPVLCSHELLSVPTSPNCRSAPLETR